VLQEIRRIWTGPVADDRGGDLATIEEAVGVAGCGVSDTSRCAGAVGRIAPRPPQQPLTDRDDPVIVRSLTSAQPVASFGRAIAADPCYCPRGALAESEAPARQEPESGIVYTAESGAPRRSVPTVGTASDRPAGGDDGMSTVEYAVGTVVAAAFAAVLYRIVTGDSVVSGLTNLINTALSTSF